MRRGGDRIPFAPSPHDVVEKMLSIADPRPDEVLIDLGAGDGRIVISAAERYRCKGLGVEIDRALLEAARDRIRRRSLWRADVIHGDLFQYDFSGADVVTLYLLPSSLERLRPKLLALRRGARIVCHDFPIPGVRPSEVVITKSFFTGRVHKIYLYEVD